MVGDSGAGKTKLIRSLIPELKKRNFSVGVIKHCAHGFDFGRDDKDSSQFLLAGADSVALVSPEQTAVLQKNEGPPDFRSIAESYLNSKDIVFIEGGRAARGIPKLEVLSKGDSKRIESSPEELLAVVSESEEATNKPVFHPERITELADFLVKDLKHKDPGVHLECDGKPIPLNPFVRKMIENSVLGMVKSLDGVDENPRYIYLTLKRR